MAARFTLHGMVLSGPAYKIGLLLSLAGEPFDYVHVSMRDGAHKAPDHMRLNRFGQVPALVDNANGRALCQSASILEYIADKLGRFGGATLDERISVREWMFWEYDRLAPHIYRPRAHKLGYRQFDPAVIAQHMGDGATSLTALNDLLRGRDWMVGEGLTIADIDSYGVVYYAAEGGYDLSAFPNVVAWMKRIEALPGYGRPEDLLPMESRAA